jgi:hypothetical protein
VTKQVDVLTTVEVADPGARRVRRSASPPPLGRPDRVVRGLATRAEVPLESHAVLAPTELRADPVELLERQAATRVPELVPIRYGRMLVSPFTFYRGAALVMAADLAGTPNTGLRAQLCGDAHLSNFGIFASPAPPTAARSRATAGTCSSSSVWSTWPARRSASAASGRGPGSC